MTGRDDSAFRLGMSERLLAKAREAGTRCDWREASLFARGAVEAAVEAILACFSAVPRSHEPGAVLERALSQEAFLDGPRAEADQLRVAWDAYGMEDHVLLSYGDEVNRIDPWALVTQEHAISSIAEASRAHDFASRVRGAVYGLKP